ncbi:MAG: ABC transporter substrate-binding protein [Hyphomicrobiales bacterium]|nr:ABC transporter substrate-binding protein [Hyphomicrobiales bacterium]
MPRAFLSRTVVLCAAIITTAGVSHAQAPQPAPIKIDIAYIKVATEKALPLSRLDNPLPDDGFAGARLALNDNNTSGRFLKQEFVLTEVTVPVGGDAVAAAKAQAAEGRRFILLDAPAETVLAVADALKGQDALVFNIAAPDSDLRNEKCRVNVLHTAPSRDMLADGLAQYLIWKKWSRWFLVHGALPDDLLNAEAVRRAAKRFGAKIVAEKEYKEEGGARRTDSGHEQVQAQMPVFTQDAPEHDVLVVADENEVFGPYVPYRTWSARPVAGTSGLTPASWHPAHEQWGATQFQNRFMKLANRGVRAIDYHAWLAVRAIGEAAARVRSAEFKALNDYIKGPELSLAAFKGQKLTFRKWNGQLRHAVVLGDRHLPVTWSPQPGFLHPVTPLDTLGVDEPESKCRF